MPQERRALLIAILGPAIQMAGLGWEALHLLFRHWDTPLTARHLMYEPGVLLVVVGFFVSVICIPVAIEVARAREEELAIPLYEPAPTGRLGRSEANAYSEAELAARRLGPGRARRSRDRDQLPRLRS